LKAEFSKWNPEAQKAFRARHDEVEADYTRKTQELAETRKAVEPLLTEVQRYLPVMQRLGFTPDRFLAESATVAHHLTGGTPQHQGQAIAYLMQLHKVPLESVLAAHGVNLNPGETVKADPNVQQSQQELFEVRQRQAALESRLQEFQVMQAQTQFEAIGASKDQNGTPLYPHWDRVKGTMINLVRQGLSTEWNDAYQKAVRLDDELYKQSLAQTQAAVADAEAKRRQEALDKAKKAQPVVTSAAAPAGGTERKGLDAHLAAALDKHYRE
jgi:hypothetical protein